MGESGGKITTKRNPRGGSNMVEIRVFSEKKNLGEDRKIKGGGKGKKTNRKVRG